MKSCSDMSGGEKWGFNNSVYLSEKMTADKNYCLAYMMRKKFPENTNLEDTLDFYFQCCSIEGNTSKLASIGALLAAGGISPISGKRILKNSTCSNCLSLMYSCGMYDYSGSIKQIT